MGLFAIDGFLRLRFSGRWLIRRICVHSLMLERSLGLYTVVRFTLSPWGSFGSFEVIGFTQARPRGCWVHPASLGSIARNMGFIRGR